MLEFAGTGYDLFLSDHRTTKRIGRGLSSRKLWFSNELHVTYKNKLFTNEIQALIF